MLKFTKVDLLILDDIGASFAEARAPIDLYEIIWRHYQRGAIVMTSNCALDEVGEFLGDQLLASAAMDRLLDNAHRITTFGGSFRNPPQSKRVAKKTATAKLKEGK